MRIEVAEAIASRLCFRPADVLRPVEELAMEIGKRNLIVIDNPDRANARRREIKRRRRAEPARAETKDARRFQPFLAGPPDLREHDVTRVTPLLGCAQRRLFVRQSRSYSFTNSHLIP